MLRATTKVVSMFVIFSLLMFDFTVPTAKARMIDTETAIAVMRHQDDRARIAAFLERQDVQLAMIRYGVDPDEAKDRVASLTDSEVRQLAQAMDKLPAGGDGVGAVLFALLLVFFVLLFTDIMGYTDVFPFVHKGSGRK